MASRIFDVEIAGAGAYLPEQVATNADLLPHFPGFTMTAEQLYRLLGARERRVAPESMTCAAMMARAGQQALQAAGISPGDVDLIIACPTPPDAVTPPSSAVVQHLIGASLECTAFDLNMACTGSIAALECACRFLDSGFYQNVLIVAGTIMSRDNAVWTNPMHRFIFGDGAGAVVLRRATRGQQLALKTQVVPDAANSIVYPLPRPTHLARGPFTEPGFIMGERDYFFRVMETAVRRFVAEFWNDTGYRPEQITRAVIHQPTRDLFLKSVEVAGIPLAKVFQNYEAVGNVIAAELFIALAEINPLLRPGEQLYSLLYGAGYTFGALVYELP